MGLQSLHPSCLKPHEDHSKCPLGLSKPQLQLRTKTQTTKSKSRYENKKKGLWKSTGERELCNTFMVARFIGETEWSRAEKEEKGKEVDNHGYGIMAMKNKIHAKPITEEYVKQCSPISLSEYEVMGLSLFLVFFQISESLSLFFSLPPPPFFLSHFTKIFRERKKKQQSECVLVNLFSYYIIYVRERKRKITCGIRVVRGKSVVTCEWVSEREWEMQMGVGVNRVIVRRSQ